MLRVLTRRGTTGLVSYRLRVQDISKKIKSLDTATRTLNRGSVSKIKNNKKKRERPWKFIYFLSMNSMTYNYRQVLIHRKTLLSTIFFAKWNSTIIFTHSYFVFAFFSLQYTAFLGWSKLQDILSTGILQLLTSFKNSKWRKISYLNIDFIYRKCNFVSCYITCLTVLIPQRVSINDKSILDQKYYLF